MIAVKHQGDLLLQRARDEEEPQRCKEEIENAIDFQALMQNINSVLPHLLCHLGTDIILTTLLQTNDVFTKRDP